MRRGRSFIINRAKCPRHNVHHGTGFCVQCAAYTLSTQYGDSDTNYTSCWCRWRTKMSEIQWDRLGTSYGKVWYQCQTVACVLTETSRMRLDDSVLNERQRHVCYDVSDYNNTHGGAAHNSLNLMPRLRTTTQRLTRPAAPMNIFSGDAYRCWWH